MEGVGGAGSSVGRSCGLKLLLKRRAHNLFKSHLEMTVNAQLLLCI